MVEHTRRELEQLADHFDEGDQVLAQLEAIARHGLDVDDVHLESDLEKAEQVAEQREVVQDCARFFRAVKAEVHPHRDNP